MPDSHLLTLWFVLILQLEMCMSVFCSECAMVMEFYQRQLDLFHVCSCRVVMATDRYFSTGQSQVSH